MNNILMFLVSESERHVYYLLLEFMLIGRKQSWICLSSVGGHLRLSLSELCAEYQTLCVLQLHNLLLEHCFMCGHFAKVLWQRWLNIILKNVPAQYQIHTNPIPETYSYARISCTAAFWNNMLWCCCCCFNVSVSLIHFIRDFQLLFPITYFKISFFLFFAR